jgi:hypothetical protein
LWTIDYFYMTYGAELLSGQEESRDKNYCYYALQTFIRIIGFSSNMTAEFIIIIIRLVYKTSYTTITHQYLQI